MIEVDDAMRVGEAIEIGPSVRMIGDSRSPVQDQQDRTLSHLVRIGRQMRPGNVNEETDPTADIDPHHRTDCPLWAPLAPEPHRTTR
jgi:hypothetical protein